MGKHDIAEGDQTAFGVSSDTTFCLVDTTTVLWLALSLCDVERRHQGICGQPQMNRAFAMSAFAC
jgi:hypothetical protein